MAQISNNFTKFLLPNIWLTWITVFLNYCGECLLLFMPFRIPYPIQRVVLCNGIALGSDKEWDFLLSFYINTTEEEEGTHLLQALSCSKEPWILNRWGDQLTLHVLARETRSTSQNRGKEKQTYLCITNLEPWVCLKKKTHENELFIGV